MGLSRTASDRFIVVGVESKETSEQYLVDLQVITLFESPVYFYLTRAHNDI